MSKYFEVPAEKSFASYIRKFWLLDNSDNPIITPGKYALPNGCVTIAFISGNNLRVDFGQYIITIKPGIYLIGQISKKVAISLDPYAKAIMAQVNPWLPPLVTNHPFNEFTDNLISLEYINRNLHSAFSNIDLSNVKLVISTLYKELETYLYPSTDSRLLQFVFNELRSNPLKVQPRITEIALQTGYSTRHIEQKFKQLIGLSPKEIQQILQLRALINELSNNNGSSLSHLAHKYGYFDQSHFIKSYHKRMLEQPAKFDNTNFILPLD